MSLPSNARVALEYYHHLAFEIKCVHNATQNKKTFADDRIMRLIESAFVRVAAQCYFLSSHDMQISSKHIFHPGESILEIFKKFCFDVKYY